MFQSLRVRGKGRAQLGSALRLSQARYQLCEGGCLGTGTGLAARDPVIPNGSAEPARPALPEILSPKT